LSAIVKGVGVVSFEGDARAIQHVREAIAEGKNWYLALLEAIRLWRSPEEDYNGRHLRYLIDREAFDWLVLAERLCEEVDGFIPEKELIDFLFFDRAPIGLAKEEFEELIGNAKYQAYLNYLYGILVEEVLILAVVGEIRKGRRALGLTKDDGVVDEAYQRLYGSDQQELIERFRKGKGYPRRKSISLSQLREFTYWLFKQRLKRCDKSCVASDTKKALAELHYYLKLKGRNPL